MESQYHQNTHKNTSGELVNVALYNAQAIEEIFKMPHRVVAIEDAHDQGALTQYRVHPKGEAVVIKISNDLYGVVGYELFPQIERNKHQISAFSL